MTPAKNLNLRAGLLSVLIFLTLLGIWYIATAPSGAAGGGTAAIATRQTTSCGALSRLSTPMPGSISQTKSSTSPY